MQDARVGRVGDVPDGEYDRHNVLARVRAAELTGSPLRSRTLLFFSDCVPSRNGCRLQPDGVGVEKFLVATHGNECGELRRFCWASGEAIY